MQSALITNVICNKHQNNSNRIEEDCQNMDNGDATWSSWFSSWWCPTSPEILADAEHRLLRTIKTGYIDTFVTIQNGNKIRTIETVHESGRLPLVLLHGFGSGVGLWVLNIDALAEKQKVYAIDVLGFGRSSRPEFPQNGAEAEEMFITSLEQWRQEVGLEKFILLGHSFGGYLAASYSIKHFEYVRHLILADPWGIPEKTPEREVNFPLPVWAKGVASALSLFNPLAGIRVSGPLGPTILKCVRPDLKRKFNTLFKDDDVIPDYIYQINAQQPSGEVAFMSMTIPHGWAKYPIIHRVKDIDSTLPMTIIFGSRSWMDIASGWTVKYLRPQSYVNLETIKGAGHHVYADKHIKFNEKVNTICDMVHDSLDFDNLENESVYSDS